MTLFISVLLLCYVDRVGACELIFSAALGSLVIVVDISCENETSFTVRLGFIPGTVGGSFTSFTCPPLIAIDSVATISVITAICTGPTVTSTTADTKLRIELLDKLKDLSLENLLEHIIFAIPVTARVGQEEWSFDGVKCRAREPFDEDFGDMSVAKLFFSHANASDGIDGFVHQLEKFFGILGSEFEGLGVVDRVVTGLAILSNLILKIFPGNPGVEVGVANGENPCNVIMNSVREIAHSIEVLIVGGGWFLNL